MTIEQGGAVKFDKCYIIAEERRAVVVWVDDDSRTSEILFRAVLVEPNRVGEY